MPASAAPSSIGKPSDCTVSGSGVRPVCPTCVPRHACSSHRSRITVSRLLPRCVQYRPPGQVSIIDPESSGSAPPPDATSNDGPSAFVRGQPVERLSHPVPEIRPVRAERIESPVFPGHGLHRRAGIARHRVAHQREAAS